MRSLADASPTRRARMIIEAVLRLALVLSVTAAIYFSLTAMGGRPSASVRGDEFAVRSGLREWSTASSPREAHIVFDSTPSPLTRAWAAALRAAGTSATWSSSLPAVGIAVEPIADPRGASRVFVSAPRGSRIVLHDSVGLIDTISVRNSGAVAGPLQVQGAVGAAVGHSTAVGAKNDSLSVRPILVVGRAGWEGKFVAAALEEYGWRVNARFSVSPGNDVTQGAAAPIDTSNYSAVIVIDSSASRFAQAITRYVKSGGGLVVLGEGNTMSSLQQLLPGEPASPSSPGTFSRTKPRDALALRALGNLKPDAIALERRGSHVAIAARRAGSGRIIQIGYDDAWRWRMAGVGDAVEEHRNWLSSVVSAAAYAPRVPLAVRASDPAPTAAIFTSLGAPTQPARASRAGDTQKILLALFVIALVAMVAETASRRLDGRP